MSTSRSLSNIRPVIRGQRVFTAGHSFHAFVGPILADLARLAGIAGHEHLGTQFMGGSRVIEHWQRPDPFNQAKHALRTGCVDVLSLSPIFHPDPGIEPFARLAVQHNSQCRVLVQASWVPFDSQLLAQIRPGVRNRDAMTGDDLCALHAPYFETLEADLAQLHRQLGRRVLFEVPVGQALIRLRERIRDRSAPGLQSQEELFTDALGHPATPVQALAAYAAFAVIYRSSPIGLPIASLLAGAPGPMSEGLNQLLQELAWQAVLECPWSGVSDKWPSLRSA